MISVPAEIRLAVRTPAVLHYQKGHPGSALTQDLRIPMCSQPQARHILWAQSNCGDDWIPTLVSDFNREESMLAFCVL